MYSILSTIEDDMKITTAKYGIGPGGNHQVLDSNTFTIDNLERDSKDFVTLYTTDQRGHLCTICIDQEVIDQLKTI